MTRIAVVSTPRSGNTWLRGMLRSLVDGEDVAEHRPGDFPWASLPENAVLQLHWYPTEEFRALLAAHGFSVVTIVRHPLDVLVSILHFCRHEPATAQWLDGEAGDEQALVGCSPSDEAVVDYATGDRFRRLLGVSMAWAPLAQGWLRYEDLVADPTGELQRILGSFDVDVEQARLEQVVTGSSLAALKPTAGNHHYWQGQPGLWTSILPDGHVERLMPAVSEYARAFGYALRPAGTSAAEADETWRRLAVPAASAMPSPAEGGAEEVQDSGGRSQQRLSVLHIIGRLNVGGPAHLVTGLARHGHHAVAAGAVQEGEVEHADLSGVELHRIAGLGRKVHAGDDARALRSLTQLLRAERPGLVHTHTAKGGALGRVAAEFAHVPRRVHTFHGHLLHGYFSPRTTAAVVAVERTLARRTDRLVAVGERVRDDLLAAGVGRPEQYAVIPPGVTLGALPDRDEARRRLDLTDDRLVVAYVGRLAGIKRPERVVELARRLPDALVLMVGDGPARAELEAEAPPNVRFLGWRSDVEVVYAAADVAVLTSDNEGMPLSLVEAALAGVPAVTTDVGSAAEVVLDGRTGLVVPVDVDLLTASVERLLSDDPLRRSLGRAATEHATATYSVERMVKAHLDLYATLR